MTIYAAKGYLFREAEYPFQINYGKIYENVNVFTFLAQNLCGI